MTTSVPRLWIGAVAHPAFRCGGWARLRLDGGPPVGWAGGERQTTSLRMTLTVLAATLADLPPPAADASPLTLGVVSDEARSVADVLAGRGPGPEGELDLWAKVQAAARGRRLTLTPLVSAPNTPAGFVTAWAEFAMNRAKDKGPFSAAIPKPNLATIARQA